jgi:hypothetical protein
MEANQVFGKFHIGISVSAPGPTEWMVVLVIRFTAPDECRGLVSLIKSAATAEVPQSILDLISIKMLCNPPLSLFLLFDCDVHFTMTLNGRFLLLGTLCLLYDTAAAQTFGSVLTSAPKCAVSSINAQPDK